MGEAGTEVLGRAREALARRAWGEAYDLFIEAGDTTDLSPEDLEGLAEAAHWSGHLAAAFDPAERAHGLYVAGSDGHGAARSALTLASLHHGRGATSVAAGWLATAQRLLADLPECAEHGRLAATLSFVGLYGFGNLDYALEEARKAYDIGTRLGDRDLQAYGLHLQGQSLVRYGRVAEGLALIDEAMATAVSGQLGPLAATHMYCYMLTVCMFLADYRRAAEWSDAAGRCHARLGIAGTARFSGDCRAHHAHVLRAQGEWAAAESEATIACDDLCAGYQNAHVGLAMTEIGLIRLHRGDLDGAEQAFAEALEAGWHPERGVALLRLAQGKPDAAMTCIQDALAASPSDDLSRALLLPVLVEVALARGDLDTARTGAQELQEIAGRFSTPAIQAWATTANGALTLAVGHAPASLERLRQACRLWLEAGVPYEAARARVVLAQAHIALGNKDDAALELRAARSTFARLGAQPDLRRVDDLLMGVVPSRTSTSETLLFTDIAGSTELVEAIGDEAWGDLLRWHDATLRAIFAARGGEEVDHIGDGFFIAFDDTATAIDCAVAIQRTLLEQRRNQGFAPQLRVGVHRDTTSRRGRNRFGKGVHLAARIAAVAGAGEILASESTIADASGPVGLGAAREVSLKGIRGAVRVVPIEWRPSP